MSNRYCIFLIDDNRLEHKLWDLLVRIKKLPIKLNFYQNATNALKDLRGMSDDDFPNAIVTDIQMPTMDGFEMADVFLKEFHPRFPDVVFCITSSTVRPKDIERAKTHELVSSFIEKPISEDKILEHILNRICE